MAGLEETLALDYSEALAGVDELEARLTAAARSAEAAFSEALAGAFQTTDAEVSLAVDTSAVDAAATEVANLSAEPVDVAVAVDDSEVTAAAIDLADLNAVPDPDVVVEVDDSQVLAATDEVSALVDEVAAVNNTSADVNIGVGGADQVDALANDSLPGMTSAADNAGAALTTAGAAAAVATGGLSGANAAASSLIPTWGAAAAAGAGVAAATAAIFNAGVKAEEGSRRLKNAYGEETEAVLDLSGVVKGLPKNLSTLGDLTLATGSSTSGVKIAIADFAELGKQSGATGDQLVTTGRQFGFLADYVAATRPQLGTAEQIADKLTRTLARGGPFAARLGLDVGTSAQITARASEMYGKAASELTVWEKATAGAATAIERLGPDAAAKLQAGLDGPVVQLRRLETELRKALATAGQPLVQPILDALKDLQPTILAVADAFGRFVGAALPGVLAALQPVLGLLRALATVLSLIPGQVLAFGAAFLVANRAAAGLISVGGNVAEMLSRLATRLGQTSLAGRFDRITNEFGALEKATVGLTKAQDTAQTASARLAASLMGEQAKGNAAATAALAAHMEAVEADNLLMEQQIELAAANKDVRVAEAAVAEGAAGAEDELVAARARQVAAERDVAAATDLATQARVRSTAATEAAIGGATSATAAAELEDVAAASTAAQAGAVGAAEGVSTAATAASGASALIGPLGIALAVAAGAFLLFGHSADDTKAQVDEAKKALDDYRDSLQLTAPELAALDPGAAAAGYAKSEQAVQRLTKALQDKDLLDPFNKLKLNVDDATASVNGNEQAARRLRQQLIDTGKIEFGVNTKGGPPDLGINAPDGKKLKELQQEWIETGRVRDQYYAQPQGEAAGVVRELEAQRKANEEGRRALLQRAEAEINAGDATNTGAIQSAAAAGILSDLTVEQQAAARSLLTQADAAEKATQQTTGFAVALEQARTSGDAYTGGLLEGAQQASEAITALNGAQGAVDPGDLGAARALAASDAFKGLPKDVQEAVNGVVEYADAELKAAQNAGDLVASTGEVANSLAGLTQQLDTAVGRYESLTRAQANNDAANRSIDQGIRDLDKQTSKLGTSLDAQGATFDAASVTAKNYREYLALLTDDQQRFIEAAKGGDGQPLSDDAKAAAVRRAIQSSPEALKAANDEAKNSAGSLLDYFDQVTGKIQSQADAALKAGTPLAQVNAQVAAQVTAFRNAATEAGVSGDAVDAYLTRVGLSVNGLNQDALNATGVSGLLDDVAKLNTALGFLPKDAQVAVNLQTDPEKQRAALEEQLNGLSGDLSVAIRSYLAAPDPQSADFALAVAQGLFSGDSSRAVQILTVLGLDQGSAERALGELNEWNRRAGEKVKLVPTVETVGAIAKIDADFDQKKANIKVQPGTDEYKAEVDKLTADREAKIRAIPQTGDALAQLNGLAAPQTKDLRVNVILPEWAKRLFSTEPATVTIPFTNVPLPGGQPPAQRPRRPGERGPSNERGAAILPPFTPFLSGGSTADDPRVLAAVAAEAERVASGNPSDVRPGFYGPGSYVAFAEDGTQGEYLISRSGTDRPRNRALVRAAAADLGVDLAPRVSVYAPLAAAPGPGGPGEVPGLADAVGALRAASEAVASRPAGGGGRPPVVVEGGITVHTAATDPYETARATGEELATQAFLHGGLE